MNLTILQFNDILRLEGNEGEQKDKWAAMKTIHVLSSKGVNVWCLRES